MGSEMCIRDSNDTDIEKAAKISVAGKFRNAGQVCVSPTRFLVQDDIKDKFTQAVIRETNNIKVGNGLDDDTNMGPLIAERRIDVMNDFVKDAIDSGAKIEMGGNRMNRDGSFFSPTIMTDVDDSAKIMNEEPFGPLLPIDTFKSVDEVIDRANRLDFGLASCLLYTSDAADE